MPRVTTAVIQAPCTLRVNGVPINTFNTNKRYFYLARSDVTRNTIAPDGWRDPSAYTVYYTGYTGPHGVWTNKVYGGVRTYTGPLLWTMYDEGWIALPSENEGLRSKAEVGALLKLKDQKVNLAQAFAERGQIATMFATNITRIAKAYHDLKRGNIKGAARQLGIVPPRRMPRELAGRWLELQYGWKPLLSDIHGVVEEFGSTDRLERYRVSVRKREKSQSKGTWFPPDLGGSQCPVEMDRIQDLAYHCRLDYLPDNFEYIEFSSLGLTNPAYIAWEVTPFSFVVDWAYPIGNWLSALDAAYGYKFLGGTMTTRSAVLGKYRGATVDSGLNFSQVTGNKRIKAISRVLYGSSPIPTLPRLKNPWSYAHAANAVALLTQVVTGARSPYQR